MGNRRADRAFQIAKQEAQIARANFRQQLAETTDRVRPARLKQDATDAVNHYVDEAKDVTIATVKEHPVVFGASFLGTLAFWYRKPLSREIEQRSPDALDRLGAMLEKMRDWVAPDDWTPKA